MMKKIACLGAMIAVCVAFADTYTWIGGASGNLSTASNWTPAPSGAFSATDELVIETPAEITLDASATVGKITLSTTGGTQFIASENATLTVANIENTGSGTVTFACPVQFSGTYYVTQNGPVKFPGGATATYPDNALRTASSTDQTRTLDGERPDRHGFVTVEEGARLEIASGTTFTNHLEGAGTLYLENGVTLACGTDPFNIGAVELAQGASVTLTAPSGVTAPYALLTGVDAADVARFTYAGGNLSLVGGALMLPYSARSPRRGRGYRPHGILRFSRP